MTRIRIIKSTDRERHSKTRIVELPVRQGTDARAKSRDAERTITEWIDELRQHNLGAAYAAKAFRDLFADA